MKNLRNDIDELIDWYEKFRPTGGQVIPVNATIKEIAKACGIMLPDKTKETKAFYRNRLLQAMKLPKAK